MPEDFTKCTLENPKGVRTIKIGDKGYMHICIDKNGKWHKGEIKVKKS